MNGNSGNTENPSLNLGIRVRAGMRIAIVAAVFFLPASYMDSPCFAAEAASPSSNSVSIAVDPSHMVVPPVLDIRLGDLADRIVAEGFPAIRAGQTPVTDVWVEDIDHDGQVSPADNLLIALPTPPADTITFLFDSPSRNTPLAPAKEVSDETFQQKNDQYTADVSRQGGQLVHLSTPSSGDLLHTPFRFLINAGGLYHAPGEIQALIHLSRARARMFLVETPVRRTLICQYDVNDAPCLSDMGQLRAGLTGRTIYKFYPDRLAVEACFEESTGNNIPFCIIADVTLPQPGQRQTSFVCGTDSQATPIQGVIGDPQSNWNHVIALDTVWISFDGPKDHLGVVFERPNWQVLYTADGRVPQWGDYLSLQGYFDGLCAQVWLIPMEHSDKLCRELSQPAVSRDPFRTLPADMVEMNRRLGEAEGKMKELSSRTDLWPAPAEVQYNTARAFSTMANRCWKSHRPRQAQRLARKAIRYAKDTCRVADMIQQEQWANPGYQNKTNLPGFARGVYWTWIGSPARQEERMAYAKKIGVDYVHSMDIQNWPGVEEKLTTEAIAQADFTPSRTFLDMLQRHDLKGVLLTMCPMWGAWVKRLPFPGNPDDYTQPPAELEQSARWVERYVRELQPHPGVGAYAIHNEPVCHNGLFPPENPQVKAAFVQWLKKRHKTLTTLNRTWNTSYKNWEDIVIPKLGEVTFPKPGMVVENTVAPQAKTETPNRALAYDFLTFEQECFCNYLAYLKDAAVKVDPDRPAFSKFCDANLIPNYASNPFSSVPCQYKVYGANYYYGMEAGTAGHGVGNYNFTFAYAIDVENEAGKLPVWCTEFNQGWWKPYRMGTRSDFTTQVWTAMGKGLRGLFPFSWSPGQWALFHIDDAPAPAAEAMAKVYAQFHALDTLIAGLRKPEAKLAYYYAKPSFFQKDITYPDHPQRALSSSQNQLKCLYNSISLAGGVPATFLTDKQLGESLEQYKAMVVVEADCMPKQTVRKMASFVERGGTLIVVGPAGRFNEYGLTADAAQKQWMRSLQGADATPTIPSFVYIAGVATLAPSSDTRIETVAYTNLDKNTQILGTYSDGKPAVIEHRLGKGKVLSIGCPVGVASDVRAGASMEFLCSYLAKHGVQPSARTISFFESSRNDLAIVGLKDEKGNDWLILVNAGVYPLEPTFEWTASPPQQRVVDILSGRIIPCETSPDQHPTFTLRLPPGAVSFLGPIHQTRSVAP